MQAPKGNSIMKHALSMLAFLASLFVGQATLAADETVALEFGGRMATELRLPIGRSQIISSPVALEQVVIGAPDIADIKILSAGRVLILGIKPGRTNLVFRQKGGDLVALMDVVVGYDLTGVKKKVKESMPAEDGIEVRDSNDRVILSGTASSAAAMDMALNIARSYVPNDKVINLMQVGGGQQVMLEARIAEVSRNSLKELGVQTNLSNGNGRIWMVAPGNGMFDGTFSPAGAPTLAATGSWTPADNGALDSLTFNLQALEQKGLAKTLAEPNLVALSGQEANFLAGGEIPIPVAQSSAGGAATISVDYKEFGVGLRFTPTVLDPQKISLKFVSEVSELDPSNSVGIGAGIEVPAILTRRAGTTVELADGQSFAVAGLMRSDAKNALSQLPLIGDLPIIGALFRSSGYQREETELVIIVTAHLVKPVKPDSLTTPADIFTPPSDIDQYLLGRLEGAKKDRKKSSGATADGGMEGSYGHQVNAEKKDAKH